MSKRERAAAKGADGSKPRKAKLHTRFMAVMLFVLIAIAGFPYISLADASSGADIAESQQSMMIVAAMPSEDAEGATADSVADSAQGIVPGESAEESVGELPDGQDMVKTITSEPASDGTFAEVTGYIPDGAVVKIEEVTLSNEQLVEFCGEQKVATMADCVVYDITILVDGEEWQPDDTVNVAIKHPSIQVSDSQILEVVHVDGAANKASVVSSELDENGDIAFSAEGFSLYIVYTVDFHFGEYTYSIEGGSSVLLSQIFSQLGIEEDAADVFSVEFSNSDYVSVEQVESDWQLVSLASFDTEEVLTLMFDNGKTLELAVTDPPNGDPFEPGLIKIKLNLYDWNTGDPLPYVEMRINKRSDVLPQLGIISLTSDGEGVAYAEVPYTVNGSKVFINNGTVEIYDAQKPSSSHTRFDMDASTSGYNYNTTQSGRIRNHVTTLHAGADSRLAGTSTYDDFYFHGGMPANGAYVEFNVYMEDVNSGTHNVSFDTSTIANAADFESIQINHGDSISSSGQPIPTPVNNADATCPLLGWTCNGVDFDSSAAINHDIVLTPKWASMCTVTFDTSKVANASDFPAQNITGTGFATEPSVNPVNTSDSDRKFLHWSLDGEEFDFSTPITKDITLTPVWEAQGIIHFKVYMWDHEYYVSHGSPGAGDHRADGQTKIPIDGVKMVVKSYPGGASPEGTPAAADWDNSWNSMIEDYRKTPVGRPGGPGTELEGVVINYNSETGLFEGDYIITADQLQYLKPGYVIDTDPDCTVIGSYDRGVIDSNYTTGAGISYHDYTGSTEFGEEKTVFDWDWYVAGEDTAGAGNTGVRVIPESIRRGGSLPNGTNLNDVAQVSQDMIDNGFEFTFVCYVVPAVVVEFDSNGGTPDYPMQKFKPVNSIPMDQQEFKAVNPGSPEKSGKVFAGWYEVLGQDDEGNDIVADTPWDFNRVVNHSMTLKAMYADRLYTVLWQNEDGTKTYETDHYRYGDVPYYDGTMPTKASTEQYDYEFIGWELVDPAGDDTIYPERTGTTVKSDQIYQARFEPKLRDFTVKWVDWNWNPADETGLIEKDENVPYGDTAHFDGAEPERAATADCVYTFAGWKMIEPEEGSVFTGRDGEAVHSDQIYQAQYTETYTCKSLTVEKNVIGKTDSDNQKFPFELTVLNQDDSTPDLTGAALPTGVSIKAGTTNVLCFSLASGAEVVLEDFLPVGAKVTLVETSHDGFRVVMDAAGVRLVGDTQEFVLSNDLEVVVTNQHIIVFPVTGASGVFAFLFSGALLVLIGTASFKLRNRRVKSR